MIPPEVVGVAVLALHNLVVHRLLPAPAGAALNLASAAGSAPSPGTPDAAAPI
jgi:hypothetical protein